MKMLTALIAGIIFGIGLALSQMIDPNKVLNFLDWFGSWDPSLIFVMAGAIAITLPGYYFLFKRSSPIFSTRFDQPRNKKIDKPLVIGATLFGVGWGLSGYCPGPGLANLLINLDEALVFCSFLILGFLIKRLAIK